MAREPYEIISRSEGRGGAMAGHGHVSEVVGFADSGDAGVFHAVFLPPFLGRERGALGFAYGPPIRTPHNAEVRNSGKSQMPRFVYGDNTRIDYREIVVGHPVHDEPFGPIPSG